MNETENSSDWLKLDLEQETNRIATRLREILSRDLKRRGLVIGLSGGIDSSVTAALAVKAVGPERVFGLLMPERQSDSETLSLSRTVADALGIDYACEDISGILEAVGFYRRYDEAVRQVVPDYGAGWKSKIAIQHASAGDRFNFFWLVAESPLGDLARQRLPLKAYLEIVAATNFKQRSRKMMEYYHADRLNYAVAGTPNRLEYDQGFFVKNGDGSADLKPIAHLYKTQVYQLAEYLGVPEIIRRRPPTTDTYGLAQGQDEFYFPLPYARMDLCLYGKNQGFSAEKVAKACDLEADHVLRVWADIDQKRATTRYLQLPPLLIEPVAEIQH